MLSSALEIPRRLTQRFQRQTEPGALPGTISPPPDEPASVVRLVQYGPGSYEERVITDLKDLEPARDSVGVTWVDVEGVGDAETIRRIGKCFSLHPLALEDVVNVHQRPKLEMFDDYLFVVVRAHTPDCGSESEQIAMFLGHDFVVTFQEYGLRALDVVRERLSTGRGRIREQGADYLLYTLLDAVIDAYFPILEDYGENLDALDAQISRGKERGMIEQIHDLRAELLSVRRSVWPLREVVNQLIRDSADFVGDNTDLYLRDCYDHTVQIIDVLETDRELCADLRDYYLTLAGNRMNQVMKFLTIIATLFIPLSFIAGLYGMNFNPQASPWNMPELNWFYGYPFALGLMVGTAGVMVVFFWRKGWLW